MTMLTETPDEWGCLLHHEYHQFSEECAVYAARWLLGREPIGGVTRLRNSYEMELEARILSDIWKLAK
jgi:hypothetical protein